MMKKPILQRLLSRIEIIPIAGCWIWMGSSDKHGYGRISTSRGESPAKVYRVTYESFVGKIPPGKVVRHLCDTPSCCNPEHLAIGTQKDNMIDASKRNRLNRKSLLNLRPGAKGFYGAGSKSNGELYGLVK